MCLSSQLIELTLAIQEQH